MPTYEYACTSCRRRTEAVQRFSDPPLTECPHCGGQLKRVFHPVGIVLKGSGFYATENRAGKKTTAATEKSEKKSETTSSETKTETKTETKPEKKTEAKPAAPKKKEST